MMRLFYEASLMIDKQALTLSSGRLPGVPYLG